MKQIAMLCAVLLLTLGCSDQQAPTALSEGKPDVSINLQKGPPSNSGPIVARFNDVPLPWDFLLTGDPSRELASGHIPIDNVFCGGAEGVRDLVDYQEITTRSQAENVIEIFKSSETNVAVYDCSGDVNCYDEFWGDNTCDFLTGPQLLAEGTAKFIATITDKSATFRWEGWLEAVDGGTLHYVEVQKILFEPFAVPVEDIKLTPVPGK